MYNVIAGKQYRNSFYENRNRKNIPSLLPGPAGDVFFPFVQCPLSAYALVFSLTHGQWPDLAGRLAPGVADVTGYGVDRRLFPVYRLCTRTRSPVALAFGGSRTTDFCLELFRATGYAIAAQSKWWIRYGDGALFKFEVVPALPRSGESTGRYAGTRCGLHPGFGDSRIILDVSNRRRPADAPHPAGIADAGVATPGIGC